MSEQMRKIKNNEWDEKHKSDNFNQEDSFRKFDISLVEIPIPILNNRSSYVHNFISFDKQSATKSSSLVCSLRSDFAFGREDLYSSNEEKDILLNIREDNTLNSSSESFDLSKISSLCFKNSSLSFKGANRCSPSLKIKSRISPCEISILKNTLASRTTSIYINLFFFSCSCIDNLTLFANSSASFSVNLDFETMSLDTESSNSLTKDLINLAKANSNLSLNSSGTSALTTISVMSGNNGFGYLKLSVEKTASIFSQNKNLSIGFDYATNSAFMGLTNDTFVANISISNNYVTNGTGLCIGAC